MKKSTLIDKIEKLILEQIDTGPVYWAAEDHGDAVLLVGTYPAETVTDEGDHLEDEPWKLYGGDLILGGLPTPDDSGMDAYQDKWGDDAVAQWVLWRVEG
jgi:hypothetical protein